VVWIDGVLPVRGPALGGRVGQSVPDIGDVLGPFSIVKRGNPLFRAALRPALVISVGLA
jgi:hypothetical protein